MFSLTLILLNIGIRLGNFNDKSIFWSREAGFQENLSFLFLILTSLSMTLTGDYNLGPSLVRRFTMKGV